MTFERVKIKGTAWPPAAEDHVRRYIMLGKMEPLEVHGGVGGMLVPSTVRKIFKEWGSKLCARGTHGGQAGAVKEDTIGV